MAEAFHNTSLITVEYVSSSWLGIIEEIFFYLSHDFRYNLYRNLCFSCEPGSSVGITTDCGLDGPGSNPGGYEIFRPFRPALGAHPASSTMGAIVTGTFPGLEAAGAWG